MNKSLPKILMACIVCLGVFCLSTYCGAVTIKDVKPGEDVFGYITRVKGSFDQTLYQQVIGASNAFKEGDVAIAVGADNEATRQNARALLKNTKIKDLHEHPLLADSSPEVYLGINRYGQVRKSQRLDHGGVERLSS